MWPVEMLQSEGKKKIVKNEPKVQMISGSFLKYFFEAFFLKTYWVTLTLSILIFVSFLRAFFQQIILPTDI